MSTELTIANDLGMSLAEAIGVSTSGGETRSASLPRVNLMHNGIMGTIEVNGNILVDSVGNVENKLKIEPGILRIGTLIIQLQMRSNCLTLCRRVDVLPNFRFRIEIQQNPLRSLLPGWRWQCPLIQKVRSLNRIVASIPKHSIALASADDGFECHRIGNRQP